MIHGRLRVDVDHYPGLLRYKLVLTTGFAGGSDGKESSCNAGDLDLIPGLGRSPGGGNVNHSSTLAWRISMDRDA